MLSSVTYQEEASPGMGKPSLQLISIRPGVKHPPIDVFCSTGFAGLWEQAAGGEKCWGVLVTEEGMGKGESSLYFWDRTADGSRGRGESGLTPLSPRPAVRSQELPGSLRGRKS